MRSKCTERCGKPSGKILAGLTIKIGCSIKQDILKSLKLENLLKHQNLKHKLILSLILLMVRKNLLRLLDIVQIFIY